MQRYGKNKEKIDEVNKEKLRDESGRVVVGEKVMESRIVLRHQKNFIRDPQYCHEWE